MRRRDAVVLGGMFLVGGGLRQARAAGMAGEFARLEAETGGRLGVALIDTESGARSTYRADEGFPMGVGAL